MKGLMIGLGQVAFPRGADGIETGDSVVVLTTQAARSGVEQAFRKHSL